MSKATQLPSGNWRVRVYIGRDSSGKKQYKSITASGKKEALYKAKEFEFMQQRISQPQNITLGEAIDRYIDSKSNILSPATIREYKNERKNCLKSLMDKPLCALTPQLIQKAINEEALRHSPKYVKNAHGLLSATLKVFHPDFVLNTTLPKKKKREIYIPCDDDISRLISAVKGSDMYLPILLSATLSLRRSEICGLRWRDINFITNKVTVRRAMVLNDQKEWVLKDPKTFTSFRTITLPEIIVRELKQCCGLPDEPITTLTPNIITNRFRRIIKENGFEHFRFHDLRHYNASVMLALNLPDKYAMERGGWSSPSTMKNIYQHTFEDRQKQYDTLMANYFNKVFEKDDTKMTRN